MIRHVRRSWLFVPLAALVASMMLVPIGMARADTAIAPATEYLTVSMTRTDTVGSIARSGDILKFNIFYTNLTSKAITAFPRSSNLTGALGDSVMTSCRFANLPADATRNCTTATHTVTADDVAPASFMPIVTFDATSDSAGVKILKAGYVATVGAITIDVAPARSEGTYLPLASEGEFDFTCHRIPALTTAPNGDVLASCDGRPGGCGDAPQANSIIQRRSTVSLVVAGLGLAGRVGAGRLAPGCDSSIH